MGDNTLVDTRTQGNDGSPQQLIRYQLGNHLGSASVELDNAGALISYEEYYPYGTAAFQAGRSAAEVSQKRYRYTGKERDDETGFSYHGARYYAPWLGRWTSPDPAHVNLLGGHISASIRESQTEGIPADDQDAEKTRSINGTTQDGDAKGDQAEQELKRSNELQGLYRYVLDNPIVFWDPNGRDPVVGRTYVLRGTYKGEPISYTGSTAQQLRARLSKDHPWSEIIQSKTTTIEVIETRAKLNEKASGRGTYRSARNEALRSAEEKVLSKVEDEAGRRSLNKSRAATPEHEKLWAERHNVKLGRRFTLKGGVKIGAFAGLQLLDIFNMYREEKMSQYGMAPYLLEDEKGVFTLQEQDRGIFRSNYYFKSYQTGDLAGQTVKIEKDEFKFWKKEAETLWGTTDWKGDWVPGLLRRELPVVNVSPGRYGEMI